LRGLLSLIALAAASCGAPLMKLPPGPGAPAADAAEALQQATAECRGIRTLTAEVAASGKAAGGKFRGRLTAGVAAPSSARIEAVAPFGAPVFIFVATGDDATLLLPRDERILEHGRPGDVLAAVAGVPLNAADLFETLTGCAPAAAPSTASERGADWRVLGGANADVELYLHRDGTSQPWRLAAVIRRPTGGTAWRAEYREHQNGVPRSIRLASVDAPGRAAFDLSLRLTQVETNTTLDAAVFRVEVPRSATPITLDELRNARPGVREN
jgi:outer membrane lipoprotein-sorting protein